MGQLNTNDGADAQLQDSAVIETVVVTERLHRRVRELLRAYPGSEVAYRSDGHEAWLLTGEKIICVRHGNRPAQFQYLEGEWLEH